MTDAGHEVSAGQSLQLDDKLLALTVRDMFGEQEAVDEQTQLAVGEVADEIEVGENGAFLNLAGFWILRHPRRFAVLDVVAEVDEIENISSD